MKTLSTIISIVCGLVVLGMVAMAFLEITPADLRTMVRGGELPTAQSQPTAAVAPAPTPFATVIVFQPQPVVYQQVGQEQPQIAIQQPPPPATAEPAAPVQVQPQPAVIVVHERPEQGQNIVTGAGACKIGGSVARRCGDGNIAPEGSEAPVREGP